MSCATFLFLSSPSTYESRYYYRPPVLWDTDHRFTGKSVVGDCSCIGRKQSNGVKSQNGRIRGSHVKRSIIMSAGLGRYSGAVHGNLQRKSRRRRPPLQQDEGDEGANTIENAERAAQSDKSNERESQSERTEFGDGPDVVADGTSVEGADSADDDDGDSALGDDEDAVAASEEFEYKRYLQEIGVNVRVHEDGDAQVRSGDSSGSPDGVSGTDVVVDPTIEMSSKGQGAEMSTKGQEVYHEEKVTVTPEVNIDRTEHVDDKGPMVNINHKLETDGDREKHSNGFKLNTGQQEGADIRGETDYAESKKQIRTLSRDNKIGGGRRGRKTAALLDNDGEIGSISAPVAATQVSSPERLQESFNNGISHKELVDTNSKAETGVQFQLDSENIEQKFDNGFAQKRKKQAKKTNTISSDNPLLKPEKTGDNQRVREVSGGAEQPAIFSSVPSFQSVSRPEQILVMNCIDTSLTLDQDLEPEIEWERAEKLEQAGRMKESGHSAVRDPVNTDTHIVNRSGNAVKMGFLTENTVKVVDLLEVDTNIIKEWSSAPRPPKLSLEDRPMIAVGNASGGVMSLSTVLTDDLSLSRVASAVLEQAVQVGSGVVEIFPDVVTDHVGQVVDQVTDAAEQFANTVTDQVQQVAENVSSTASQVAEQVSLKVENVASSTSQVVDQVTEFISAATGGDDDEIESDSDDEFEAFKTSNLPEFRGKLGLENFTVKQEGQGVLTRLHDFYSYMLKQPLPEFAVAMFSAPVIVSALFTLLYLPQFEGLAFDETARDFFGANGGDAATLHLSWKTLFQVFMFSLSLSTGLQPELAPLSPYTLVVANLNALVAQLVFVFLSGAVFARLSQPSHPVRCSSVALVSAPPAQRKQKDHAIKVLSTRYVLAGPQPCELVDVKVDLVYKYNTYTRTGAYFRATQPLKLVRPEIAFCTHGMLIRHVIDDRSPLYQRTPEMLKKEDAIFCLSVVGLERASMQPVFHVQHYCVVDGNVIWDADFEDLILINKKNKRIVDHSRLSMWRRHCS